MADYSEFEKDLSSNIYSKTGEHIYINLATENVVEVRALSHKGSMPLGVFWVHVFQHPNNYPVSMIDIIIFLFFYKLTQVCVLNSLLM